TGWSAGASASSTPAPSSVSRERRFFLPSPPLRGRGVGGEGVWCGAERSTPSPPKRGRGEKEKTPSPFREREKRLNEGKHMCGIAGIVDLTGRHPVPGGAVRAMATALYHRGPDEDGFL